MKISLSFIFKFHYIEDAIIVKLENFLFNNNLILNKEDFLKLKYSYKDYILDRFTTLEMIEDIKINSSFSTLFFEDNSEEVKRILEFCHENNFVHNKEFTLFDFPILEYEASDYKDCDYFKINLNLNQSDIHHDKLSPNVSYIKKALKTFKLEDKFSITYNEDEIHLYSNIMEDFILQKFYVSKADLFFVNKNLGRLLLKENICGFDLIPIKVLLEKDNACCYQLKNINLVEAPKIKTPLNKLFIVNNYSIPNKTSKYHSYYQKCNDVQIYEEDYIINNFKDINITYSSIFSNDGVFITSSNLIISRRVYEILESMGFEFLMEPIYSTKDKKLEDFKVVKEIEDFLSLD